MSYLVLGFIGYKPQENFSLGGAQALNVKKILQIGSCALGYVCLCLTASHYVALAGLELTCSVDVSVQHFYL